MRTLDEFRAREFEQGRYNPVISEQIELVDDNTPPGPGRQHDTIYDALAEADADGTRSILDIERVGNEDGFGVARRLTEEELEEIFGTTTPTRQQVLKLLPMGDIERGQLQKP